MFTDNNTYFQAEGNGLTGTLHAYLADVCELNNKYYLTAYPDFYFIVRKSCDPTENDRVCLYRENTVNVHLFGSSEPGTMWVSNELRLSRSPLTLHNDMAQKAGAFKPLRNA